MSVTEITREQLVRAAEIALEDTENQELRRAVLNVAQTADRIAGNWWIEEAECGCLIGTLRAERGQDAYPSCTSSAPADERAEHDVGLRFVIALHLVLGREPDLNTPLTVV